MGTFSLLYLKVLSWEQMIKWLFRVWFQTVKKSSSLDESSSRRTALLLRTFQSKGRYEVNQGFHLLRLLWWFLKGKIWLWKYSKLSQFYVTRNFQLESIKLQKLSKIRVSFDKYENKKTWKKVLNFHSKYFFIYLIDN